MPVRESTEITERVQRLIDVSSDSQYINLANNVIDTMDTALAAPGGLDELYVGHYTGTPDDWTTAPLHGDATTITLPITPELLIVKTLLVSYSTTNANPNKYTFPQQYGAGDGVWSKTNGSLIISNVRSGWNSFYNEHSAQTTSYSVGLMTFGNSNGNNTWTLEYAPGTNTMFFLDNRTSGSSTWYPVALSLWVLGK